MVKAKIFVVSHPFQGEPKCSDFTLVEEELPALNDREYLVEAEYLSVDPYMRVYVHMFSTDNKTMIGSQVARIIESKNSDFPVGKRVLGYFGWRSHTIVSPSSENFLKYPPHLLPEFGDLSPSLALGVLGMPGHTAYFGLLEICKPKAGETLVVSGAAGAVGSHVGQIGKILGLRVIGIAGSDAKCKWLTEELGFDTAINYKTQDVAEALKKAAPNKVDCYFDNVGGDISSTVLYQMNKYGRVSVCGSISVYNEDFNELPKTTVLQPSLIFSEVKMEGFIVSRWMDQLMEATEKNLEWIREGKLKYRETIVEGFENISDAFIDMLRGGNTGKAIVKV